MNYYSRNSPVKRKRSDLPPGFLLQSQSYSSLQHTPRSLITCSPKQPPSNQQSQHSQPFIGSDSILILDDDPYYIPSHEILIQEGPSDSESDLDTIQIIKEESQPDQELAIADSSRKSSKAQSLQPKQETQKADERLDEDQAQSQKPTKKNKTQNQQKPIMRNFSFGNENELWNSSEDGEESIVSANPFIRKLFNPIAVSKIRKLSLPNRKPIRTKKDTKKGKIKMNQQDSRDQENWKKLITLFIKKRQSHKEVVIENSRQLEPKQEIGIGIGAEKQEKKGIDIVKIKTQAVGECQDSGYFPDLGIEEEEELLISNIDDHQVQRPVKKQKKVNYKVEIEMERREAKGYERSLGLLMEAINQLPKAMIPHYFAIHNELVKRQMENRDMMGRQVETIEMMKVMTKLQANLISVDDYVLSEFKGREEREIAGNQEIILSFVRRLASHF